MPAGPPAPKLPIPKIDPNSIIAAAVKYISEERVKFYIFLFVGVLVAAYALWVIYEEYRKSPIKIRKMKWGGGKFKLSDMIRRKAK